MKHLNLKLKGLNSNGQVETFKLSYFKGTNLIVYFYPQDDTPICTQEANDFNEKIKEIEKYATVIGVSSNDINDHLEFKNKYQLNFILLSDTENKLKKEFEKHNKYTKYLHRATFILDKNGNIIKYWVKVDIDGHVEEVLEYLKTLIT